VGIWPNDGMENMRLKLFDLIDQEGWTLPVDLKIDKSQGFPDVVVLTDDAQAAM
jgi:hypothetical protein